MSKHRSEPYRMRRAVAEAAQEHDGAYHDPTAMELIAERFQVDLSSLVEETRKEIARREEKEEG
jgi:hypothetical protein